MFNDRIFFSSYSLILAVLLAGTACENGTSSPSPDRSRIIPYLHNDHNPVRDKNFYFLGLLQESAELQSLVLADTNLQRLKDKYSLAQARATENCRGEANCIDQLLRWPEADIRLAGNSLRQLAADAIFEDLIESALRPTGLFTRYENLGGAELVEAAWTDAANAMNRILSVYALGTSPRYPEIDRVSYQVASPGYEGLLQNKLDSLQNAATPQLFFEPLLNLALALLEVNGRDEAGRYEPLYEGENRAALQALPEIDWENFSYSLILVPGDSPNSPGDLPNISLGGMARADYGVSLYQQGLAPFIAFSGGAVRPFQTKYAEAVEMKKYIMEEHGIPPTAILVDPHARHTTTNLRNTSRLLLRYRFPADKQALVATTESQSNYIMGERFKKRCEEELGYLPVDLVERLNSRQIVFQPIKTSLQADATDPLDP